VAGVGQQRHRIADKAVTRLDRHECSIEDDPDYERASKACWIEGGAVRVAVRVAVGVSAVFRRFVSVVVVRAVHRSSAFYDPDRRT